jgi:hypothetical protein
MNASGKTMIDFGTTPSHHATAPTTVAAVGLTLGGLAEAWVLAESTPEHTQDEAMLAPIEVRARILDGGGSIEITAWSSIPLTGRYRVGWVAYDESGTFKGFTYLYLPDFVTSRFQSANANAAGKIFDGGAMPSWTFGCWLVMGPDSETGFVNDDDGSPYVMEIGHGAGDTRVGVWFDGAEFAVVLTDSGAAQQSFTGVGYALDADPPAHRTWLHVVVTNAAGGDCVMYVNGIEVQRATPSGSYNAGDEVHLRRYKGRIYSPFIDDSAWGDAKVLRIYGEGPRYDLSAESVEHWWPGDGDTTTITDRGTAANCNLTASGSATAQLESDVS